MHLAGRIERALCRLQRGQLRALPFCLCSLTFWPDQAISRPKNDVEKNCGKSSVEGSFSCVRETPLASGKDREGAVLALKK